MTTYFPRKRSRLGLGGSRNKSFVMLPLLVSTAALVFGQGDVNRTVIDNEFGQYYGYAPDPGAVGVEVLGPHDNFYASMTADAIKAPHGHLQHFAPADPSDNFPYNELKAFEAAEVAAGRPPILVTATYAGKKRPVYFAWHLQLDSNNRPTAPASQWSQAVNLRDDRFIKFYSNIYLHKTLWQPLYQTEWQAVDNGAFRYDNYGVLDDNGVFVGNAVWDQPFAQNDGDFLNTIIYFLSHLSQVAPDVHIMINEGSMAEENLFAQVFSGFAGTIREEINYYSYPQAYYRGQVYLFFQRFQYEGPAGKAALLRSLLPSQTDPTFSDRLRTGLMTYLIFRGPNFFWGPRFDNGTTDGVPVSLYASMRDSLGLPSAPAQTQSATSDGYRLYWRNCEGGIAFLNWTGQTQTVNLGGTYYDRQGNAVTSITIPDLTGDYVLLQPGSRAQRPTINPRRSTPVSGSLAVTLATDSAQTIHYTLDGSDPTASSPLYTGPVTLTGSATVKAKAFCSGCAASFTSAANFTVQSNLPTVGFYSTADSGTPYLSAAYPLIALSNAAATPVTVAYSVVGGSAQNAVDYKLANGALTFSPGQIYQSVPITIISHGQTVDKTLVLGVSSPSGASLGPNATFTYTIAAGGSTQPTPPVRSAGSPSGTLPSSTTVATLSLVTDQAATCRYSATSGLSYSAMTNVFATTGGTSHSTALTNLNAGATYNYYVRCQSSAGVADTDDYGITFSIATATPQAPVRSAGSPSGTLPSSTTSASLSLVTDQAATCKYSTAAGVSYSAMTNLFTVTGGTSDSMPLTNLKAGTTYNYYVRCQNSAGVADTNDYRITFSIASVASAPVRSAGAPSGTLPSSTTSATLSLVTDQATTCKYSTTAGVSYSAMPNVFATTGGTSHSTTVTNLRAGTKYNYYLRCQNSSAVANMDDYGIAFSIAASTAGFALRINSGGPAYVDGSGNTWAADNSYYGGDTIGTSAPITGTTIPAIYQTALVGTNGYEIQVPNGTYTVNLKFAELQFSSAGQRLFDISLNYQNVMSNFDIFAAAGGKNRAVDLTFTTTVTSGTITILFASENGPPAINAIEILQN
jgi:hypothetical protein